MFANKLDKREKKFKDCWLKLTNIDVYLSDL